MVGVGDRSMEGLLEVLFVFSAFRVFGKEADRGIVVDNPDALFTQNPFMTRVTSGNLFR